MTPSEKTFGPFVSGHRVPLAVALILSAAVLLSAGSWAGLPPAYADGHQLTANISAGVTSIDLSETLSFDVAFDRAINGSTFALSDIEVTSGTVQNLRWNLHNNVSFGSHGNGIGQFNAPTSVAVNGTGHIFVSDARPFDDPNYIPHRVQVFDSMMNHVATITDRFNDPKDLAFNQTTGHLYVADRFNDQIQVFDHSRGHVRNIATPTPQGVAVNGTGHIFVADPSGRSIHVYDSTGSRIKQLQFSHSTHIFRVDIDPATGYLYATGLGTHTVHIFDRALEGAGTITSSFNGPVGIEFDGNTGHMFVGDTHHNGVIKVFNSTRHLIASIPHTGSNSTAVAIDGSSGTVYVADRARHQIQSFDQMYSFDVVGAAAGQAFGVSLPADRVDDAAGNPNAASDPVRFDRYGRLVDVPLTPTIFTVQSGPTDLQTVPFNLTFNRHIDASTLDASDIEVSSGTVRDLRWLLQQNGTFGVFGDDPTARTTTNNQLSNPIGVAVNGTGHIFVSDAGNGRISVFDRNMEPVNHTSSIRVPHGMAFNATGHLFVADAWHENNRVVVYDTDLNRIAEIGSLNSPVDVAVNGSGHIFVADRANDRIAVYDRARKLCHRLYRFGRP